MSKKTTVYFNEYCSHCTNLKEWLTKKEIPFKALNTEDPEISKVLIDKGITAIPFTVIEDYKTGENKEVIGFNEKRFEKIYF